MEDIEFDVDTLQTQIKLWTNSEMNDAPVIQVLYQLRQLSYSEQIFVYDFASSIFDAVRYNFVSVEVKLIFFLEF